MMDFANAVNGWSLATAPILSAALPHVQKMEILFASRAISSQALSWKIEPVVVP
jgi:hypothetical protein